MRQAHNREHGVHTRCPWENAPVADEETFHTVHLMIAINYCVLRVYAHTAGAHLVSGEHYDAIDAHAMPLYLAIKLAELLLTDYSSI